MARLAFGLIIGLAVGAAIGILVALEFSPPSADALQATIDRQNLQLEDQRERIGKLERANADAAFDAENAQAENQHLGEKITELQQLLEETNRHLAAHRKMIELQNKKIADLKESYENRIAQLKETYERTGRPSARRDPPRRHQYVGENTEALLSRIMRKYEHVLQLGQALSEEAIMELGLDAETAAIINKLLKDEGARATQALAQFLLDNIPNPPQDLKQLSAKQLLMKIMPHLAGELKLMGALPRKEQIKLARGKTDLLDYLSPHSTTAKLLYALHNVRQQTYGKVEPNLPAGKMTTFKKKYLPPDDFLFPGNLNLAFGKINWEKER